MPVDDGWRGSTAGESAGDVKAEGGGVANEDEVGDDSEGDGDGDGEEEWKLDPGVKARARRLAEEDLRN